jgi:hypothetical protein
MLEISSNIGGEAAVQSEVLFAEDSFLGEVQMIFGVLPRFAAKMQFVARALVFLAPFPNTSSDSSIVTALRAKIAHV